MRTRRRIAVAACVACWAVVGETAAEPLRGFVRGGVALPVGGYQAQELGAGGSAVVGLEYPFMPALGVALEVGGVRLSDGDAPTNPSFADGQGGALVSAALALHVRPWNTTDPAKFGASAGFWGSVSGGVSRTGGAQKLLTDVAVGYDFFLNDEGTWGLGPMASWIHVYQPDSQVRPEDANLLVLGVHVLIDGVERKGRRKDAPAEDKPAADFDGDGIPDEEDACPSQPEDLDGFDDADGCPDPDNDQDGILDADDRCPNQAEDKDGFEDDDGCPDLDNDGDGIPDLDDMCPLIAEDKDGFNDTDGCPDEDNDRDGILDAYDACPNEPENFNGYADEDGCPDEEQVRVVGDKIVLDERVHFAVNMAVVRRVSYPLLGRVAKLLSEHPDYIHIEIQGHADKTGNTERNRDLSERRAKAVMEFLIEQGIERSRLSYRGLGDDFPLLDKETEWALFMNRRVEFKITRDPSAGQNAKPTPDVTQGPAGEGAP